MVSLAFKDRLKLLRSERGITQEDLAQALDVPASTIRRYESSDEGMPKHERIQKIANYFGCTMDYLLERSEERFPSNKKESDYSLPKSVIDRIIKETEAEYKVTLRDDPLVENMVREVLRSLAHSLAELKKRD